MPNKISGLPAHVLLVHLVVVLIPVAAVAVLVAAWWPAARGGRGGAGGRAAGCGRGPPPPRSGLVWRMIGAIAGNGGNGLKTGLRATPDVEPHGSVGNGLLKGVMGLGIVKGRSPRLNSINMT